MDLASLSQGRVEAALPRCTSFNPDAELLSRSFARSLALSLRRRSTGRPRPYGWGRLGGVGFGSLTLRLRLRGVPVAPARVGEGGGAR